MKIIAHSREDMENFAASFLAKLVTSEKKATVVGLYGDLGSGKTAFTQGAARVLGVTETVTSPTFVIEKIYSICSPNGEKIATPFTHLIHIDAYRLEKSEELVRLGWNEIVANPANLILIEWPEKVADIMPADHILLKFTFIDETTREMEWQ